MTSVPGAGPDATVTALAPVAQDVADLADGGRVDEPVLRSHLWHAGMAVLLTAGNTAAWRELPITPAAALSLGSLIVYVVAAAAAWWIARGQVRALGGGPPGRHAAR